MTSERISLRLIVLAWNIKTLQIITHLVQNSILKVFGSNVRYFYLSHRPGILVGPLRKVPEWEPSNWTMKASLTRHGRSGAPHYSLYSRTQSAKAFNTPGPGTYRNEKVTVVHKGAPKYSLSSRAKSGGTSKTPG